ncbi:putative aldouronate transport system permease protein [Paenibacillus sp. UNCCL117]|uniref:ABC transporter permease n=1 Tax=unclassified Paenibacillus TaxID=185978 RepID=UPI00088E8779|nr:MULTISPECIES: ABC transporter permease subunit [unclassified Paenibacillus]SDD89726.1 carbohydrate ABC transporter membrane protein 1, CUT1 family [Paenibacillus sp. cl123]SFW44090.1 putative aldouronate transport system permease protein [Paenibacillus sp. UNCCL117]
MKADAAAHPRGAGLARSGGLLARILQHRAIYLLVLPGLLYFLLFKFVPLWGLLLAFKDYNPFLGFAGSPWVGLKHFSSLFADPNFYLMLRNTFAINLIALIFHFPLPILLALMLNEIRHETFKRFNQSIVYMPHFLSWVVVASLTFFMLSVDVGVVNKVISAAGQETISFLSDPNYFWGILTAQNMWKEAGWGTIIFLAAMAGVDPQRYEAAVVDGASRMRQIWHITLPAIRPTVIILLILRLGSMADIGFEQVLLMMNPLILSVGEVFDTYAYTHGILRGQISVGVTVGMFKGVVGLVFIVTSNYIVKKLGHEGIY